MGKLQSGETKTVRREGEECQRWHVLWSFRS